MNEVIADIQRDLSEQTGRRIEAHYKEGKGVLFIYEGQALIPQNVIQAVSEGQLRMIKRSMAIFS